MKPLTRAQRVAVRAIYRRTPLYELSFAGETLPRLYSYNENWPAFTVARRISYLEFRRRALRASFHDCLMIPWLGMWLGIETDGYTHS